MNKEEKEINNIQDDLDVVKKERDEYLDGWKRAKADFINYKQEETERIRKLGGVVKEMLILDVLPVLDSFELGISSVSDEQSKKGMELIKMQLEDVIKRYGLERISVCVGDIFNPSLHEAIGEEKSEYPEGVIIEEVNIGYMLDGKVLRPTKVKISKGSKEINNKQ
ncbi:nucleotide exchange factor GrpE [Candidatus Parcubacteria bacterium]|jgi:molecular chaperone GrpE|nr:MAG: nucleotide exchange factor GrpE [Candidatus Parcubacteria bacterium]